MVKCEVCGMLFNVITWRHLGSHDLTLAQYRTQFPGKPTISTDAQARKRQSACRANADRKGKPRTAETKQKISNTKQQQHLPAWNKGVAMTEEAKRQLSAVRIEKYKSGEIVHWNTGNTTPDYVKQKIQQTSLAQERTMTESSRRKRELTLQAKRDNGWVHPSTQTIQHAIPFLNDRDWLLTQHHQLEQPCGQIAEHLSVDPTTVHRALDHHNIEVKRFAKSQAEIEIVDFLMTLGVEVVKNDRTIICPLELDIFLPQYNIAIEHCGLYWHSSAHKSNHYHRDKYDACSSKGVRLITLYEDEWRDLKGLVKQKLAAILGKDDRPKVYARTCAVSRISSEDKKVFMDQYHIQQDGPGSISYGLFDTNGLLVGAMTFISKAAGVYVLNRYATVHRVIGGASKLLAAFMRDHAWSRIETFADLRWSEGNLYEQTGWKRTKEVAPDYEYVRNGKRYHKFNFRRRHLPRLLGERFNPALSETQNTQAVGINRIYNCGLIKYVLCA